MNCFIGRFLLVLAAAAAASSCTDGRTTGIDGTGARAPTLAATSHGRITGFGSIIVNGIAYETYDAAVLIDGRPAMITDLAAGDVVTVEGALPSENASTGIAFTIRLEHMLIGPISAIDASTASLVVFGRTVHTAEAVFDSTSIPQGLLGLKVGDLIEVSGFRNSNDQLVASRIGKRSMGGEYRMIGVASNLDEPRKLLSIGPQVVEFGLATVVQGPSGRLENGDLVDVRAAVIDSDGTLVAEQVAYKAADFLASPGDRVALEGYVTSVDVTDPQRFKVAGLSVATTTETRIEGTLAVDAKTAIRGPLSAGGTLVAETIRSDIVASPGTHTVDGLVFDANHGPIAGASINLWVQLPRFGYSYWWANGPLRSDASGRFTAPNLPDSHITLGATKPGYVQPCGIDIDLRTSVTVDIEVMAEETLNALNPPRPINAGDPTFTGTIYESTPTGMQTVPGARVWAERFEGVTAVTLSDALGRYFLCKLPPAGIEITVTKPGYENKTVWPVDTSQSNTLDVVIERD